MALAMRVAGWSRRRAEAVRAACQRGGLARRLPHMRCELPHPPETLWLPPCSAPWRSCWPRRLPSPPGRPGLCRPGSTPGPSVCRPRRVQRRGARRRSRRRGLRARVRRRQPRVARAQHGRDPFPHRLHHQAVHGRAGAAARRAGQAAARRARRRLPPGLPASAGRADHARASADPQLRAARLSTPPAVLRGRRPPAAIRPASCWRCSTRSRWSSPRARSGITRIPATWCWAPSSSASRAPPTPRRSASTCWSRSDWETPGSTILPIWWSVARRATSARPTACECPVHRSHLGVFRRNAALERA